jgi:hypothetical protein
VSEPLEPDAGVDQQGHGTIVDDAEEIHAIPVPAGEAQIVRAQPIAGALAVGWRSPGAVIPAVQAAAVAAGGFVAGAAVAGLVHRSRRRSSTIGKGPLTRRATRAVNRSRAPGAGRKAGRAVELVQIVGSRSLLVDVHLLGGSGDR